MTQPASKHVIVTVAVPVSFFLPANIVHVCIGKTNKLNTYSKANYSDDDGNLYGVSSGPWSSTQLLGVKRPELFAGVIAAYASEFPTFDMNLISQAQQSFVLRENGETQRASPFNIVAIAGMDGVTAIQALGLFRLN